MKSFLLKSIDSAFLNLYNPYYSALLNCFRGDISFTKPTNKCIAKKTKLSISEYLRKLAVGHKPKELPSEEIQTELIKMKEIIMLLDYQTKMFSGDELKAAVIKQ